MPPRLQEQVTRSTLHHHPQRGHDGPRYVQGEYPLRRIWASAIVGLDSLTSSSALESWGKILKKLKKRRLRESPQKPRRGLLRQREKICDFLGLPPRLRHRGAHLHLLQSVNCFYVED